MRSPIKIQSIDYAASRDRKIAHTDWIQYWIELVYLKPVDLQLY